MTSNAANITGLDGLFTSCPEVRCYEPYKKYNLLEAIVVRRIGFIELTNQ